MKNNRQFVYISYTRADFSSAQMIRDILGEASIPVFIDSKSLDFGMDYAASIANAIKECQLMIVVISNQSITSQWILKEVKIALQAHKVILPILIEEISQSDFPLEFRTLDYLLLRDVLKSPNILISKIQTNNSLKEGIKTPCTASSMVESAKPREYTQLNSGKKGCFIISLLVILSLILLFFLFSIRGSSAPDINSAPNQNPDPIVSCKSCTSYYDGALHLIAIVSFVIVVGAFICMVLLYRKQKRRQIPLSLFSDVKVKANIDSTYRVLEKGQELSLSLNQDSHRIILDYSKYNSWKKINCFIAGSIALQPERDALRSAISIACNRWSKKNFQILSFTYEDFDRKFTKDGQQSLYDYFITHDADYAIFIIKGDIGDFTIREFDKAYNAYKTNGRPSIVVYNNLLSKTSNSAEALRDRVRSIHQYWIDYNEQEVMRHHFLDMISTELFTLFESELN